MEELQTQNLVLDTSFIESQNFLAGSKMIDLSKLSKERSIKLFITDLTFRETISRFAENLKQSYEKSIKQKELLTNNIKILRNFDEHKTYFNLPEIKVNDLYVKFIEKFNNWIKNNRVTIISSDRLSAKSVLNDYFNSKRPFGPGKKKHEFPDAFSLLAIKRFFKIAEEKVYLLTHDNDLIIRGNKYIIPISDSSALFDLIIRAAPEIKAKQAIGIIETEFKQFKLDLEEELHSAVYHRIEEEINNTHELENIIINSLEDIELSQVEIKKYSIVNLNVKTDSVKIECEITFSFIATFTGQDYSKAWYNKEDRNWHFVETKIMKTQDTFSVPALIFGEFDTENEKVDFKVESINYDNYLGVFQSLNPYKL